MYLHFCPKEINLIELKKNKSMSRMNLWAEDKLTGLYHHDTLLWSFKSRFCWYFAGMRTQRLSIDKTDCLVSWHLPQTVFILSQSMAQMTVSVSLTL